LNVDLHSDSFFVLLGNQVALVMQLLQCDFACSLDDFCLITACKWILVKCKS